MYKTFKMLSSERTYLLARAQVKNPGFIIKYKLHNSKLFSVETGRKNKTH